MTEDQHETISTDAKPTENVKRFKFWRETLGAAQFFLAPMVDASELPWRILSRRYGAQVTVTPMLHSEVFVRNPHYRKSNLQTDPATDSPLTVQFCANDPDTFLEASKLAAPHCCAIDLNLGCPQGIARRGHYGAFLMEEPDLIFSIINKAATCPELGGLPITAKMRVYESIEQTIEFARLLVSAGVSLLTVHGRRREQKGVHSGLASWDHIRAVREAVGHQVPVIANGNIQSLADARRCLDYTGCHGIMVAEASLYNPAVLAGIHPPCWQMASEYLDLCRRHPVPHISTVRGHLFKIFYHILLLESNFDLRDQLVRTTDLDSMDQMSKAVAERYDTIEKSSTEEKDQVFDDLTLPQASFPLPVYLCQPNYRSKPPDEENKDQTDDKNLQSESNIEDSESANGNNKRKSLLDRLLTDSESGDKNLSEDQLGGLSNKKLKRLIRSANAGKTFEDFSQSSKKMRKENYIKLKVCLGCPNVRAPKCDHQLCKSCCKSSIEIDKKFDFCTGHKFCISVDDKS